MIINKIRLNGLQAVELPLRGVATPADIFICKGVDGLGPVEVDNIFSNGKFIGRVPQEREISMRVALNPNWYVGQTVESLRTTLYGLLSPNGTDGVLIEFINGSTTQATVMGYVKSMTPAYFNDDPEVVITFSCEGSFLSAPSEYQVSPLPTNKTFPAIPNIGTAPTGFKASIQFTAAASFLQISSGDNSEMLRFTFPFATNDILTFDTREGQKTVLVTNNGVESSRLDILTVTTVKWPTLKGGSTTFRMSTTAYNWVSLSYKPLFWGV